MRKWENSAGMDGRTRTQQMEGLSLSSPSHRPVHPSAPWVAAAPEAHGLTSTLPGAEWKLVRALGKCLADSLEPGHRVTLSHIQTWELACA